MHGHVQSCSGRHREATLYYSRKMQHVILFACLSYVSSAVCCTLPVSTSKNRGEKELANMIFKHQLHKGIGKMFAPTDPTSVMTEDMTERIVEIEVHFSCCDKGNLHFVWTSSSIHIYLKWYLYSFLSLLGPTVNLEWYRLSINFGDFNQSGCFDSDQIAIVILEVSS